MSSTFSDTRLRRYLAGALTPPRREEVEEALLRDPLLQARLAELRQDAPVEPVSPWRMPPVGLWSGKDMEVSAEPLYVMSGEGEPESVAIQVSLPEGSEADLFVLLERTADGWEIILPTGPDDSFTAGELPRESDGRVRLDIEVQGRGPWRFAVLLVPPTIAVDWASEEPWAAVQQALAEGRLSARVVDAAA